MNNILQLKGHFLSKKNANMHSAPRLPGGSAVSAAHLADLKSQLEEILLYFQSDRTIDGALVSVRYRHIVAKSNRIKSLLTTGATDAGIGIRGSKFYGDAPVRHVFTHYIKLDALEESIRRLGLCADVVDERYGGVISCSQVKKIGLEGFPYQTEELPRSRFLNVVVDSYYVERFAIDRYEGDPKGVSIVTLYKTDIKAGELLEKLGIGMIQAKALDETTVRLDPDEMRLLLERAPYLIAMETCDLSQMVPDDFATPDSIEMRIPSPRNEPVVGVLDTLFSEDAYFSEWVDYTKMVDDSIETELDDFRHGTEVSSIIVDGPALNPELDDGCGRFRVRHFGVSLGRPFSSFTIAKSIREAVAGNRDIKVWNLSLGSAREVERNFISPVAAELDKIQREYDVTFVIAGTNTPFGKPAGMRIGSPADSINSIVVNSVDFHGMPASYHRSGPVLSFFNKPDVSYYGGDGDQRIRVWAPWGAAYVSGTSFAAPWVARKMAYLVCKMGFSRETAKALLIDSAAGWNRRDGLRHDIGYGVVPKRIEDILQTQDDEIRFIMSGVSKSYETYAFNIPVPCCGDSYPFFARAAICYYPDCERSQGVDYTCAEMDIHFGRVRPRDGRAVIESIDSNRQSNPGFHYIPEEHARRQYRKWDNIKLVNDVIRHRCRPRKAYVKDGMWGISIKTKQRLGTESPGNLKFSVVVTLKEMNGKNRIDDFIQRCQLQGWVVNPVFVDNRLDVYNKSEEEVVWD